MAPWDPRERHALGEHVWRHQGTLADDQLTAKFGHSHAQAYGSINRKAHALVAMAKHPTG